MSLTQLKNYLKNDTSSDYTQPTKLQKLFVRLVKNRNNEIESYTIFKPASLLNIEVNVEAIKYKNVEEEEEDYDSGDIQKLQEELQNLNTDLIVEGLREIDIETRRKEIEKLRRKMRQEKTKDVEKLKNVETLKKILQGLRKERKEKLKEISDKEEELSDAITSRLFDIEKELRELRNQKIRRTRFKACGGEKLQ